MQKQTCKPLGFQKHPCPIPRPHLHQTHLPFLGLASGFLVNVKNVCQGLSHGPLGDLWPSCVSPHPGLTHTITMSEAFDCAKCSESLYGRKYIQTDSGPYCVPCYDNTFANTCAECQQLIGHDSRELFYEDRHFHEGCFRCCRCQRSLADEPFTCQDSELLCNDCYCSAFSSQCSACGETVMPGSRKLEYGGQTWHEHCFLCSGCEQPLGSRSFVPDKGAHYCVPCYENKFAPRCARCSKTLTQGGVTYRDQPWHRECLVCTGCQTPLAGQQFTSREDDPYCVACFGELFAPKCSSCKRPITGLGGGKYVSFEERHWHHSCFSCARCSTSLVGQGFVPDGDQVLCQGCSQAGP
ncbi:four and a half LIM domains protein 3 [Ochotona curzoniae]|uniref:four and a half LIM domains protein 3 n=2 Tax=Ochotona TaxID=9977 RepID=UPI001B347D31|nr:four and a half LIM domains protein 3 [Ochotona curzoniae]